MKVTPSADLPNSPTYPSPLVCRWDLDKTYLKTDFETLRDLVRIPFEKAEDKVNLPGVVALIRSLKQSGRECGRAVRIHFISASPPQIGAAIREKLRLDDIEYDGIVFKDQLQNLVRGKFRNLREQVGYKLTELLSSRAAMAPESREVLFGDDWESDPIIYSIYADVLSGRLDAEELRGILDIIGVDPQLVLKAAALCPEAPAPIVERIYINLERRTPLENFRPFGARLVPAFNYLQTAACLYQDSHLTLEAVATVAQSLIDDADYTPERIANSLADIERRGHLSASNGAAVRAHLVTKGQLRPVRQTPTPRSSWWQRAIAWLRMRLRREAKPSLAGLFVPPAPAVIDYRTLVSEWRTLREGGHT